MMQRNETGIFDYQLRREAGVSRYVVGRISRRNTAFRLLQRMSSGKAGGARLGGGAFRSHGRKPTGSTEQGREFDARTRGSFFRRCWGQANAERDRETIRGLAMDDECGAFSLAAAYVR
jgi:hypothetical protein